MSLIAILKNVVSKEWCPHDGARLIWENHHRRWGTCPACERAYWHEREFEGPEILKELKTLDLMVCSYQAAFCAKCRRLMEIGEPMFRANTGIMHDVCFSCGQHFRTNRRLQVFEDAPNWRG